MSTNPITPPLESSDHNTRGTRPSTEVSHTYSHPSLPATQSAPALSGQVQADSPPSTPSYVQPRHWKPTVTWVIIAMNVLIWLASTALERIIGPNLPLVWGAKHNGLIVQGQAWRMVTPVFLHLNGIHLAFNMYAIYMIGPQIERYFGHARFLSIYLLSGVYGVLCSFILNPNPSAGASGAIFGLVGTQAVFFYRYRHALGQRGRRLFRSTLTVIAFNLVLTFTTPNIDIWGHLGGLFAGALLGWNLTPRYQASATAHGPSLVDLNGPRQWGATVLGAIILLVASTWMAITLQAPGM